MEVFHVRMPTMLNELIVRAEQQTPWFRVRAIRVCQR